MKLLTTICIFTVSCIFIFGDEIILHNGKVYQGKVLLENDKNLVIETSSSVEIFDKKEIKNATIDKKKKDIVSTRRIIEGKIELKDNQVVEGEIYTQMGGQVVMRKEKVSEKAIEQRVDIIPLVEIEHMLLYYPEKNWNLMVSEISDGVKLMRGGQSLQVVYGQYIQKGDTIITTGAGSLELLSIRGDVIVIGPNTYTIIEQCQISDQEILAIIKMTYGFITASLKKANWGQNLFSITTPNAGFTSRGTSYKVAYDKAMKNTQLLIHSGLVGVRVFGRNMAGENICGPEDKTSVTEQESTNVITQGQASEAERDKLAQLIRPLLKKDLEYRKPVVIEQRGEVQTITTKKTFKEKLFTKEGLIWSGAGALGVGGIVAGIILAIPGEKEKQTPDTFDPYGELPDLPVDIKGGE